ncbi:hypothetical protein YPPY16_0987, partial [Yersinia pestis PY-16]
MVSHYRQCQ